MDDKPRRKFHPVYLILLIPYVAFAWVPFYDRVEPQLFGIPFFYWWQIVWIVLTALCIVPVYRHQESAGK
jgi:uncharacterized membrane protein YdbT with pleckstrin-like domain